MAKRSSLAPIQCVLKRLVREVALFIFRGCGSPCYRHGSEWTDESADQSRYVSSRSNRSLVLRAEGTAFAIALKARLVSPDSECRSGDLPRTLAAGYRRVAFSCCCLLLAASGIICSPASGKDRPNIVLIVTDDQGLDLGCYGNQDVRTPHLDQLAKEGTRFRMAFATTASCSASRAVLLTGLHSHANGQYGLQHSYHHFESFSSVKGLPVRLSESGYESVIVGKHHVGPPASYRFDTTLAANHRNTIQMAEAVDRFLSEREAGRPFFLYFCPTDPHRAANVRTDLPENPDSFGNLPNGYSKEVVQHYDASELTVPSFLPDRPSCRAELAMYYQSISRIDQGIGRLVQSLKDRGVWEQTVIIFTSDHGMAFPGAKTTAYDPGLRVPLIVRLPGEVPRNLDSQAMISFVDLTPTILELAEVTTADNFHGKSFVSRITDQNHDMDAEWSTIFGSHSFHEVTMYYPMRTVRERKFKLIWNIAHPLPFPFASDLWSSATWQDAWQQGDTFLYGKRTIRDYVHRPVFELYDLEADPDEIVNLANRPEHFATLGRLKKKLQDFQRETGDPWVLKWQYE